MSSGQRNQSVDYCQNPAQEHTKVQINEQNDVYQPTRPRISTEPSINTFTEIRSYADDADDATGEKGKKLKEIRVKLGVLESEVCPEHRLVL